MIIAIFDVEENILKRENVFNNHSYLLLQCFQKPSFFGSSKIGMFGTQTYTRGIDFLLSKNVFNHHSLLPLQCFRKPSLSGSSKLGIVWYSNIHERYRFPPRQKMLLTTVILSFLYNVFKNFPFSGSSKVWIVLYSNLRERYRFPPEQKKLQP